ncbi:hypothetical protein MKW92_046115 [Papaver armeniacum]|nr:hypothetical protein MKW92_046115 [Papaver armeniacum]
MASKTVAEVFYKLFIQRNSVYIPVVCFGAFACERAVDYGVKKLWDRNNVGKSYKDIPAIKATLRSWLVDD